MRASTNRGGVRTICRVADWAFLGVIFVGVIARAQAPANTSALILSATSDSAGAIKIDILRWSTDAERDQLLLAWTRPAPPAPAGGGRGGRGRGGAAAAPDPTADDAQDAGAPTPAAATGRGGGGRGGGRGGNAGAEPTAGSTPESSLAAALGNAPTVGYLWSAFEVSGYALRYAVRLPAQDGGQRIVLIPDRRLGAFNYLW